MTGRDLHNRLDFIKVVAPIDSAADATPIVGAIIDMRPYLGFEYVIQTGILADAGAAWTVLLEEGDDSGLSDAAAVDDLDMLPSGTGQEAAASFIQSDDGAIKKLGYIGIKAYTRITITPAGNSTSSDPIAVLGVGLLRTRGNTLGS